MVPRQLTQHRSLGTQQQEGTDQRPQGLARMGVAIPLDRPGEALLKSLA